MEFLLKHKDKIVSFGLLPTIITLIGLHFFPTTEMLGVGLVISITALLYDIFHLKGLNFFLLQGTIGIGLCFFLRVFYGYQYVPLNGITPALEFMLLIFAFIHVIAPDIYFFLLKKLRLTSRFSYILEARIIFALSAIHLIILQIMISRHAPLSENWRFFMGNVIPVSIYILCLIANITGIRMAAKYDILKIVIRIAPLCRDKLLLVRREDNKWDLPVIRTYNGALRKADSFAEQLVEDFLHYKKRIPLMMVQSYTAPHPNPDCFPLKTQLYILPVENISDVTVPGGENVPIDKIMEESFPKAERLYKELLQIWMVSDVWKEMGTPPVIKKKLR